MFKNLFAWLNIMSVYILAAYNNVGVPDHVADYVAVGSSFEVAYEELKEKMASNGEYVDDFNVRGCSVTQMFELKVETVYSLKV